MRVARLGAAVASVSLVASGATLLPSPASADQASASAAASWLAGQLGSNGLLPGPGGFGDVGVSIDAGFTFESIGGQDAAVTKVADAVSGAAGQGYVEYSYPYDSDDDGTDEQYDGQGANPTAKALAFLQSLPVERTNAGSVNLQQRMEALTTDGGGANAGRIVDVSLKDGQPDGQDYANTLGQSFAVRGLTDAGSSEAGPALQFLLQQQCPGGGFRLSFADKGAASQKCASAGAAAIDATALAVGALTEVPATPATERALFDARTWLISRQAADGSYGGGTGTSGANSNSTGLAAIALGEGPAAAKAAAWVAARQVPANATGNLASVAGGIAYDDAARTKGQNQGVTSNADRDQWQRATAQAAPALLVTAGQARTVKLTGAPTGYVRRYTVVTLDGSGLSADRLARFSGTGLTTQFQRGSTTWTRQVQMPASTSTPAFLLADDTGRRASTSVKVLGAKTLTVARGDLRHKRGTNVTVTLSGLAPGERAAIYYAGALKRDTLASSAGVLKATFSVGSATGDKQVVGYGQFSDLRRGTATIRVVR